MQVGGTTAAADASRGWSPSNSMRKRGTSPTPPRPSQLKRANTTSMKWQQGVTELQRERREKLRSVNLVTSELQRRGLLAQMPSKTRAWFIVDPRASTRASAIDITTAVALIFTLFVTPFEVSFLRPALRVDGLFVANRLVDLAFLFDIGLQFVVMYPTSSATLQGAKWEDNPWRIAGSYLRTWFPASSSANRRACTRRLCVACPV